MSQFDNLEKRIGQGEVIILDGAIGTQLQEMGLPIYHTAWAATALQTLNKTDLESQALFAGLVNAANGNHDVARNYFQIAAAKSDLLPEEQTLLRQAADSAQ